MAKSEAKTFEELQELMTTDHILPELERLTYLDTQLHEARKVAYRHFVDMQSAELFEAASEDGLTRDQEDARDSRSLQLEGVLKMIDNLIIIRKALIEDYPELKGVNTSDQPDPDEA